MKYRKENFGLPKKTIEYSVKKHKKPPKKPLENRRNDIIRLAKKQKRKSLIRPLLIGAVAASLIGFVIWSVVLQTENPASTYAQIHVDEVLYELNQDMEKADYLLKEEIYGKEEMTWNWTSSVDLTEEEINHMLQEWSVEMSENEIYHLENL
ncbi:MAG: hypothetical protein GVX78_03950 [Bacteroidetes bacterium]|jgi:hypothetical protein|nr:hypothetical protein [Bacteroidota bacterium]